MRAGALRTAVCAVVLIAGVLANVGGASADVVSPGSNPFAVSGGPTGQPLPFTITADGFTPGQSVFVEQCDGTDPSSIGWSVNVDCDLGSAPSPVTADRGGNATFPANKPNFAFTPFKGESPEGLFNCLAPNDPPSNDGLPDFTNCQVRVSSNNTATTADQSFLSIVLPNSRGITVPGLDPFTVPSTPAGDPQAFTVAGAGFASGQNIFLEQCDGRPATAPGWSPTLDCDLGSAPSPVSADANGNATFSASNPNTAFTPFKGASPENLFNCLSPNDPSPANGLTDYRNCQIRVSSNNTAATNDQDFATIVLADTHFAPGAPTIGTATRGNGSASVTFTPGTDSGSPITGYNASCSSSDGGAPGTHAGTASPIAVTGLTNGKTYTCSVTATNAVGTGTASAASNSVVPATVPGAPTIGTATRGNGFGSVTFTGPAINGGDAVIGYTASCTSSNGGAAGTQGGSSSPIVVTGLANGKTYTCTVTATNTVGTGLASAASNSFVPATVPDAPTNVTVSSQNAAGSVAFSTPANDGGTAITAYAASCTSSDGGASGTQGGASSPIVVTGLTNDKTYTCTVAATNAVGTGAASTPSGAFSPANAVAGAPTIGTVSLSNATASVRFTAPASNGGSPITMYTATCTSPNGGAVRTGSAATSPVSVPSLTPGKTYTCKVTATNSVGVGPASAASNAVTVANVPGAVRSVKIVSASTTTATGPITVSFLAPLSNGGAPITYYLAVCSSTNGGVLKYNVGAASPITVTGLTTAKIYKCSVAAENQIGRGPATSSATLILGSPAAPTAVSAVRLAAGQLRVTYTQAVNNGAAVTSDTVTCGSSNGGVTRSKTMAATTRITVTGLTAGKTYTCTVKATNARGAGAVSAASAAKVA